MSCLDDSMQWQRIERLSGKYKVMLKRNNSIVKDTLSKIWKLCSILRCNCLNEATTPQPVL